MKWSGLWELFRAYSEAPRQRSGSGPRYAIRATAAPVLKKSGMDLGILLAATKFMSVCPRLPHPKAGTWPMNSIIMATTIQDGEANALDRFLLVALTRVLPVVMRTYAAEMYRIALSLARNSKHKDANVPSLRSFYYRSLRAATCKLRKTPHPSQGCAGFLQSSERARQQWELERRCQVFAKRPISKGTAFTSPRLSISDISASLIGKRLAR